MDTKFSVALHILTLISESPVPLTSDRIADSVGTNASYIRKVLALLKRQGIVDGHQGISGYTLTIAPDQLTLLCIYQAIMGNVRRRLLDLHSNSNAQCVVGCHIGPVLNGIFMEIENAFSQALAERTLADCIAGIKEN